MSDPVRLLYLHQPWLFYEANRVSIFALKDMPGTKLNWDSQKGGFGVAVSATECFGSGESTVGAASQTVVATDIPADDKKKLMFLLDQECKKDQFTFHKKGVIIDSILRTFSAYMVSGETLFHTRIQCLSWHNDHQSKVLFTQGFLPWCKAFVVSNPRALELAVLMGDESIDDFERKQCQVEFKQLILPQLTKPTITAIWKYVVDILDVDKSFFSDTPRAKMAFYYIRLVFLTLTPMLFRLIDDEAKKGTKSRDLRTEIIATYQNLAFEPRFEHVEKDTFVWKVAPMKKRKTGVAAAILSKHVWDDELPPPPPLDHKPRPGPSFAQFAPPSGGSVGRSPASCYGAGASSGDGGRKRRERQMSEEGSPASRRSAINKWPARTLTDDEGDEAESAVNK
jgi:hypothetical protein